MRLIISIIVLFFVSCTPQKRLSRLIKKHPYLIELTDTINYVDTIYLTTEKVKTDSIFLVSEAKKDTVIIREKNLTVRTFIKGDTVYLSGECDTITVEKVINKKIPYKVIEYKDRDFNWWLLLAPLIVLIILKVKGSISPLIGNKNKS